MGIHALRAGDTIHWMKAPILLQVVFYDDIMVNVQMLWVSLHSESYLSVRA